MRLVRSWPAVVPEGRSYVQDGIERLVMDRYDYRILADVDDDILLLEWDIAVGLDDLERLIERCQSESWRVQVAPYRIYQSLSGRSYYFHPLWAHRRYEGTPTEGTTRIIQVSDLTCHLFGFGCVYLPRNLVRKFLDWYPPTDHFDDVAFSSWHYIYGPDPEVPVHWDVAAVHLHYQIPDPERDTHG